MTKITRAGVDIAKTVFHIDAVDRHDQPRWQVKLMMSFEPCLDLRMFVRDVVVDNQVDVQVRRSLLVDQVQELDPLTGTCVGACATR